MANLVGVPGFGDQAFEVLLDSGSLGSRRPCTGLEQGGDGVVLQDQRAAQDLRRVRGQNQFDAHGAELVGFDRVRPDDVPGRLPLVGDVGEVQKLVEGACDVGQRVFGQLGEIGTQGVPVGGGSAPGALGQRPNGLDAVDEGVTPVRGDHPPEKLAEQPHIVPQRAWKAGEVPARSGCRGLKYHRLDYSAADFVANG